MANEDKKDFNAMLMDSKDMPKVQIITDEKSIEKYGGDKMYFAPPIDYDKVMRLVPCGKLLMGRCKRLVLWKLQNCMIKQKTLFQLVCS